MFELAIYVLCFTLFGTVWLTPPQFAEKLGVQVDRVRGWIKRGEEHPIKSNTGRRRLNINGAIDATEWVGPHDDERLGFFRFRDPRRVVAEMRNVLERFEGIRKEEIKPQYHEWTFPDGHSVLILAEGRLPLCQDTGTATVVAKKGARVFTGGDDQEALTRGVFNTYTSDNLRYSQTAPLTLYEEKNTGTNLPAQVDLQAAPGLHAFRTAAGPCVG